MWKTPRFLYQYITLCSQHCDTHQNTLTNRATRTTVQQCIGYTTSSIRKKTPRASDGSAYNMVLVHACRLDVIRMFYGRVRVWLEVRKEGYGKPKEDEILLVKGLTHLGYLSYSCSYTQVIATYLGCYRVELFRI